MFPDMYSRFSSVAHKLSQKVIYRRKPINREKQSCNTFHFRWLLAKRNNKIWWKLKKIYLLLILGPFCQLQWKKTFLENLLLSLFFYFVVSMAVKSFRIKLLKRFRRKVSCRHTYRQMNGYPDKHEFIGPPLLRVQ